MEQAIAAYYAALEQYSGLVSDPNREQDHDRTARLLGKASTVSPETVRLVRYALEAHA